MKKFLALLSSISLVTVGSVSVVSCQKEVIDIDITKYIPITNFGIFYYPKGISEENSLPSEGEIWYRLNELNSELNPTGEKGNPISLNNISIVNITSSTAKIVGINTLKKLEDDDYLNYIGEVTITFENKEKKFMELSDIIQEKYYGTKFPEVSIFPSIFIKKSDDINTQYHATKYIDKLYPKIKDIYDIKDITPKDICSVIQNVGEFPLPKDEIEFNEEYIWQSIKKNNKISNLPEDLTKDDLLIDIMWDPLETNYKKVNIIGKTSRFDNQTYVYFKKQINQENLIKQYGNQEDKDRGHYFKISAKSKNNLNIKGNIIIQIKIIFEKVYNF